MARLVSRAELARLCGVTKAAITKACRGRLAPACQGVRVDLDHPAAAAYVAERRSKGGTDRATTAPVKSAKTPSTAPTSPAKRRVNEKAGPTAARPNGDESKGVRVVSREVKDIGEIAEMTIREVVAKFGTVTSFKDWLLSLKTIEDVREKNLRNAEMDGQLISRQLVQTHVIGMIDSGNRRLLDDSPKTIVRRVYAAAKSGTPIEETEGVVRDIISSQLDSVKVTAVRVLRSA